MLIFGDVFQKKAPIVRVSRSSYFFLFHEKHHFSIIFHKHILDFGTADCHLLSILMPVQFLVMVMVMVIMMVMVMVIW